MENLFQTLANITNPNNGLVKSKLTFIDSDSPKIQHWNNKRRMRPFNLIQLYRDGVLSSVNGYEKDYFGNIRISLYFNNELVCDLFKPYGFNFSTQFDVVIENKFINFE